MHNHLVTSMANVVTRRTNATSKSVRAINSNANRLNIRGTKPVAKLRGMETREVKVKAKGVARMEPPTIIPSASARAASLPPATANPKKHPQGNNAFLEEFNSKKRRLAWMGKWLMAARMDVKFPDGE